MTSEKKVSHFLSYLEEEASLDYFVDLYENFVYTKSQVEEERHQIEEQKRRHTAINRYGLEYDYRSIHYSNGIHPYDTFEKYLANEREALQETEESAAELERQVQSVWDDYCASCYHTNPDEKLEVEAEIVLQLVEAELSETEQPKEPASAFYDYAKRTGSWEEVRILISEINDLKDILLSLEELQANVKSPDVPDSWMGVNCLWKDEKYEDGTPYYNSFEEYLADIQNNILRIKNGIEQKRQILSSKFWEPFVSEIASLSIDDECEKLKDFLYL